MDNLPVQGASPQIESSTVQVSGPVQDTQTSVPVQPAVAQVSPAVQPVYSALAQQTPSSDTHDGAADADELLWVSRLRSIVVQTQNDPYKQAEAVQELRTLYLKERHGVELGKAKG